MHKKLLILLALVLNITKCNVWDNIFSQTEASSPIVLSNSINFKFPMKYEQVDFDVNVDYNSDLKILTTSASKNLLILNLQVFRLQIDLQQFLISIKSVINGCEKYKLVLSQNETNKISKIDIKSKTFLINLLFQFVQRSARDRSMNQYMFMPDLLTEHTEDHEQYEKNAILIVDKEGSIAKIYEDKDKKVEVPFNSRSLVKDRLNCPGQVKQLTKQDLYNLLKNSIENKQYEKIPGYQKLPFDKLPFDKLPDFKDLPKPK